MPLIPVNDVFVATWHESLNIPILENDQVTSTTSIQIVDYPQNGSLIIKAGVVVYYPTKKQITLDSFTYRLIDDSQVSQDAKVAVTLKNKVVDVIADFSVVFEDEKHSLTIKTLLPVTQEFVQITQKINGTTLAEKTISLEPDSDTHIITNQLSHVEVLESLEVAGNYVININFHDENFSLEFPYFNLPKLTQLNTSLRPLWYNEKESKRVVENNTLALTWTAFAPWVFPVNKTWMEDPYNSITWQLYYHSLGWLHAFEFQLDQAKPSDYVSVIQHNVMDYINKVPRKNPINNMSWNDHTVAWRGEVLAYFYRKYLQQTLSKSDKVIFLKYIEDHIDELNTLLDDQRFFAHNHSMFHAIALYNMSFVFVDIAEKYDARNRSLTRIQQLFTEMVNPRTGVSIEQSINYQLVAQTVFADALKSIQSLTGQDPPDLSDIFRKMIDFTLHFTFENGGAPAVGDSNFDDLNYLNRLIDISEQVEITTPYLESLKGNVGLNLEPVYTSLEDGYAILRAGATHTFTDFGKKLFSHGHHDAGNVTFANNSDEILIDSGGPYQYDRTQREYFRSPYAHNTLVIDGVSYFSNDSLLIESNCLNNVCYALGRVFQDDNTHTRLVIVDQDASLYIYDNVEGSGNKQFELIYNFHPETKVTESDGSINLVTKNENSYQLNLDSESMTSITLYNGVENTEITQGWVQPKFGVKVPTTSVIYTTHSDGFNGLTSLIKNSDLPLSATFHASGGNVTINLPNASIELSGVNSTQPSVNISNK